MISKMNQLDASQFDNQQKSVGWCFEDVKTTITTQ
jgi:hypothetical protein